MVNDSFESPAVQRIDRLLERTRSQLQSKCEDLMQLMEKKEGFWPLWRHSLKFSDVHSHEVYLEMKEICQRFAERISAESEGVNDGEVIDKLRDAADTIFEELAAFQSKVNAKLKAREPTSFEDFQTAIDALFDIITQLLPDSIRKLLGGSRSKEDDDS